MREYQGRRRWRRIGHSLPVLILLAISIILLVGPVFRLYEKNRLVAVEKQSLLEEIEKLEERRAKLAAEVAKLTTDRGVEEEIRTRFNVVKIGEKVITLVAPAATTAPSTSSPPLPQPWWQMIFDFLASIV